MANIISIEKKLSIVVTFDELRTLSQYWDLAARHIIEILNTTHVENIDENDKHGIETGYEYFELIDVIRIFQEARIPFQCVTAQFG